MDTDQAVGSPEQGPTTVPSRQVTVYSKTDCPDCFNAKRYLSNRSIPFDTRSIEDSAAVDELLRILEPGEYATPIIVAGEHVFIGFAINREHLEHVLTQMGW